jgi:hypothetical protein
MQHVRLFVTCATMYMSRVTVWVAIMHTVLNVLCMQQVRSGIPVYMLIWLLWFGSLGVWCLWSSIGYAATWLLGDSVDTPR